MTNTSTDAGVLNLWKQSKYGDAHLTCEKRSNMKKAILASLLFASVVYADKPKNIYKLIHLSPTEAIITCQNGADPTVRKTSDASIVVSCGASIKASWNGKSFTCPAGMYVWPDDPIEGKTNAYCGTHPLIN